MPGKAGSRDTRPRRIVRCAMMALAGVVLLMASYVASPPFAFYFSEHHYPNAVPTLLVVYAPVRKFIQNPDWAGSKSYAEYSQWAYNEIAANLIGDPLSNIRLDAPTMVQFASTPVRDVIDYLSELHSYAIELDPDVDGDIEVTISSTAPLRDALSAILEPHDLLAWPAKDRIVIGTSAAVKRIRAEDRASRRVAPAAWLFLASFVLSAGTLVLLLCRRGRPLET